MGSVRKNCIPYMKPGDQLLFTSVRDFLLIRKA